jgi:hypothetical protein
MYTWHKELEKTLTVRLAEQYEKEAKEWSGLERKGIQAVWSGAARNLTSCLIQH